MRVDDVESLNTSSTQHFGSARCNAQQVVCGNCNRWQSTMMRSCGNNEALKVTCLDVLSNLMSEDLQAWCEPNGMQTVTDKDYSTCHGNSQVPWSLPTQTQPSRRPAHTITKNHLFHSLAQMDIPILMGAHFHDVGFPSAFWPWKGVPLLEQCLDLQQPPLRWEGLS